MPLSYVLERVGIDPKAKYVFFFTFDDWWDSIDMDDALHPQTLLAYGMNGQEMPTDHGAPLRLKVARQLGYKSLKYLSKITVTDSAKGIGDGLGSGASRRAIPGTLASNGERMALLLAAFLLAQTSLTPVEAKGHVGEMATVCGKVVSARFAESSNRQPTFLNLDQPFPKQIFTVVIFGSDRSKFGEPEKEFLNQTICATGTIEDYRGLPQIVAKEPKQIVKEVSRE